MLEQKIAQFRKEDKNLKRSLVDSEDGEETAKKRSFLIIKTRVKKKKKNKKLFSPAKTAAHCFCLEAKPRGSVFTRLS